jgi:nitrite reductase/ring-hydroxylating ferredoxin subunit
MKATICKLDEIPSEGCKSIQFFDRDVLVYRSQGLPMATINTCVHLGGPLEREGNSFVCKWHRAEFDCTTGRLKSGPEGTHDRLLQLPTMVEDDALIYVYGE